VLRRNGVLGLVVDRRFGSRAEFVPCGGGLLGMPTGAIRMAIRCGAAVHVAFALRERDGFRLRVGPDAAAGLPLDPQAAIRSVAGHFATALRDAVSCNPDQYCLLQPLDTSAPQRGAPGAA
jgi:lauroyl/myristoyl acyltransferase